MLLTHRDPDHHANRPVATHGHRRPDPSLVIALLKTRLTELDPSSIRRQAIEQMIKAVERRE